MSCLLHASVLGHLVDLLPHRMVRVRLAALHQRHPLPVLPPPGQRRLQHALGARDAHPGRDEHQLAVVAAAPDAGGQGEGAARRADLQAVSRLDLVVQVLGHGALLLDGDVELVAVGLGGRAQAVVAGQVVLGGGGAAGGAARNLRQ